MTQSDTRQRAALRRVVNALMELQVITAEKCFKDGLDEVGCDVNLEFLDKLFTSIADTDLGRDGMLEFLRAAPAIKRLNREHNADIEIGFRYGYFFMGTGDIQYPMLKITKRNTPAD